MENDPSSWRCRDALSSLPHHSKAESKAFLRSASDLLDMTEGVGGFGFVSPSVSPDKEELWPCAQRCPGGAWHKEKRVMTRERGWRWGEIDQMRGNPTSPRGILRGKQLNDFCCLVIKNLDVLHPQTGLGFSKFPGCKNTDTTTHNIWGSRKLISRNQQNFISQNFGCRHL